MQATSKISPGTAVLICLNSMIGAGLFINTKPLSQLAGPFGFLGYIIAAIILLPLIVCIAELAALHPVAGGLYIYSRKHLGPWAGFLSSWAYFIGKTTSVAILIHKLVLFFQLRIALLQSIPVIIIDCLVFLALVLLNSGGVSVGGKIQYVFTLLKATPILFTFCAGFMYFDASFFGDICSLHDIICTIPIAIFPLLGFEVICAIGNMIQDAASNIKRVILSAFAIVTLINITFQFIVYGIMGSALASIDEPILMIGLKVLKDYPLVASMLNGAVFASIIGACFSIFTSNCWNLHTMAKYGHLPASSFLTRINKHNVPWASLLVEALLGCSVLLITVDQVPLQNISVFAQIIAYLSSSIAAWYAVQKGALKTLSRWIPVMAATSCLLILSICLQRIFVSGVSFSFLILLVLGIILAMLQKCMQLKAS